MLISRPFRFLLIALVVLAIAAPVAAGEEGQGGRSPGSSTEPYWSGLYAGGTVGFGHNHRASTTTDTASGASSDTSGTADGFVGGGQVGFSLRVGPQWVVGVEGTVDGTSLSTNHSTYNALGVNTASSSSKIRALWTADAIVGLAQRDVLFYGRGGPAWHNVSSSRTQLVGRLNDATAGTMETVSSTSAGWTIGGGVAVSITRRWITQIEYRFLRFSQTETTPASLLSTNSIGHLQLLTIGLNYQVR